MCKRQSSFSVRIYFGFGLKVTVNLILTYNLSKRKTDTLLIVVTLMYEIWISLSVLVLQYTCSWEILLLYGGMLAQYYGFCFLCISSDYDPRLDLALLCLEALACAVSWHSSISGVTCLTMVKIDKSVHRCLKRCSCLAGGRDVKASGSPQALEAHCTDVFQHTETAPTQGR